jgi:hypothetical protein
VRARAAAIAGCLALGCAAETPARTCEPDAWIEESAPLAIPLRASGAATWQVGDAPSSIEGTVSRADDLGTETAIHVDTAGGELVLEIGLPLRRLGVLPIGQVVSVELRDGIALLDAEGRIRTALISHRASSEAGAAAVVFRQVYAECVSMTRQGTCVRAMAQPLVDVVSGASIVRIEPGGVWRLPNDDDPTTEVEVVRSVRAPEPDELPPGEIPCTEVPARELAVIVRHLR